MKTRSYNIWEPVYQCQSTLATLSDNLDNPDVRESLARALVICAGAARRSKEYHAARRFIRMGLNMSENSVAVRTEESYLEWEAGDEKQALQKLDSILNSCSDDTCNKGMLLLQKAEWLSKTKTEFPGYIMENCLEVGL